MKILDGILKKQKAALVGLIVPFFTMVVFILLALLSLTNRTVSSAIAIDKLILVIVGLSPVIYTMGAIVSITALVKSKMRITAFAAMVVNIALLIFMLCFRTSFLKDF